MGLNLLNFLHGLRDLSEVIGYIPLTNTTPEDLARRYYASDNNYRIFTHTLNLSKSMFWNTELQYVNHYLIALTRHYIALEANAMLMGRQAFSSEISLIHQIAIVNCLALDAVTAAQGGVCAIVGDGC